MYRDRGKGQENLIDKRDENKNNIVKRKIKTKSNELKL